MYSRALRSKGREKKVTVAACILRADDAVGEGALESVYMLQHGVSSVGSRGMRLDVLPVSECLRA